MGSLHFLIFGLSRHFCIDFNAEDPFLSIFVWTGGFSDQPRWGIPVFSDVTSVSVNMRRRVAQKQKA